MAARVVEAGTSFSHRTIPREYRDYFEFINDPANGLRTMTLPFEGGLEFTVR